MTPAGSRVQDATLESLEREVAVMLRRARRAIALRARMVDPGLHPAAYLVLALLVERGPLRPSTLSELLDLDKGAVSRQVQQLVDLGLVSRERDPEDRRASTLTPTEAGRRGMDQVRDVRRELLRERLGEWDDETLAEFVSRLERYNAALERPS